MTQTDDVMSLVRDVLGSDMIGAYQHGSAVLGGLKPRSDLDVLVVSRTSLTEQQRRTLVNGLMRISMSPRPIELTVVVQSDVRPWQPAPVCDFMYGQWLYADYQRGVLPQPEPMPDLAALITMVLLGNSPLAGPPPSEVLDPVPQDDLREAIVEGIPDLLANLEGDERNVILTFARIWITLATGTIRSKDAAADWALSQLPSEHRLVLARARAIYLGEQQERWDDVLPQVHEYAEYIVAAIRRETPDTT